MAVVTLSSPRRRNVTPTSSVLATGTLEDVDCTSSTFVNGTPEDGEFVVVTGPTAATSALVFSHASLGIANITGLLEGPGLRMVWGSAQRSDRSALGQQRVPVFKKSVRVKTKLFALPTGAAPSSDGYSGGAMLTVVKSTDTVQGSANRLVLIPMVLTESGWAVGRLERVVTNSAVAGVGEIEVTLFDAPLWIDR